MHLRLPHCLLLALCLSLLVSMAFAAPGPDFTKPFFGCDRAPAEIPMITILWDPHRATDPAPPRPDIERVMFGPGRSVAGYFAENSGGRFRVVNAGVFGWYDAAKPGDHYWGPVDEKDADGDGWVNGHVEKWAEAVRFADKDFDFAPYDRNHDGTLSPQELAINIIIPQNAPFGTNRGAAGRELPKWEPLVVDGVTVPVISESYIGAPPNLEVAVHELSHLMLNTPDMYHTFAYSYAAGPYSLMDWHGYCSHLDPFLKLRLGWGNPRVVTRPGWQSLRAVETTNEMLVLMDPEHSLSEYFLVENRWTTGSYEAALPDTGLAVWHIVDDPVTMAAIPAPRGVDQAKYAAIGPEDWGRRAIRMIRPVTLPGRDDQRALWDGTDPATGYDLLPYGFTPGRAALRWANGLPSGFTIRHLPPAGPEMRFWVGRM